MPDTSPMGPGFFILFQNAVRGGPPDVAPERVVNDDQDLLDIITMLANCDKLN